MRSYLSLRNKKPLLTPDIAITSVGSEIAYGGEESMVSDDVWVARMGEMWNREIVLEETSKFPELEPQVIFPVFVFVVFEYLIYWFFGCVDFDFHVFFCHYNEFRFLFCLVVFE